MQLKKGVLAFVIMILGVNAMAQYQENMQSAEEILKERKEIFFGFYLSDVNTKLTTLSKQISIDAFDQDRGYVYGYADEHGYEFLKDNGINVDIYHNPSEFADPQMFDGTKDVYEWDEYPTYEEYVDMMNQFETDFPDLCMVESFGTTNEGRELLVARISDNVGVDEQEPEFFYTSTMHGDETTGYVLMLRLIDYLLTNYGELDNITNMIDNMEIWINPDANPDGTYATGNNSVNGATRGNANGIDINRNFPDPQDGPHPDGNQYQVETIAFMDFAEARDFVMSANHHGGVEVLNYPWDTWSQRHADDNWWQYVSREYVDTVHLYSPSNYMNEYDNGITNGYDWYEVAGGRQDYMNYFQHCREETMELSDIKLLPEGQLDNHWEYNYRSLINYMEQASYGFRGVVTDAGTGAPIVGAKVEIIGHDEDNSEVYTTAPHGDYYRPIKAGTYDIIISIISAPCYESVTFEDITISDYETLVLDAELTLLEFNADFTAESNNVNIGESVQFEDASCGDVVSWEWTFEGGNPATSNSQNPFVVYEAPGTYDVTLTISDGENETTTVKEDYITAAAEFVMSNEDITTCQGLFYDDGGADGNYSDSKDYTMTIYPNTSGAMAKVEFQSFNIEENSDCSYDWLKVYDGKNTSAPLIGETHCGTNSPGTVVATNTDGALTFEFHSDGSVNESGWEALISCEGGSSMPLANFEADVVQIVEGESVTFTSLSDNADAYAWTFEGGTPPTSGEENPVVTYNEPGNYDVQLVVTNGNGSDTELKEEYIEVGVNTAVSLSGKQGLKVYPNPVTNGQFVVEQEVRMQQITVMSLSGKLIKTLSPHNKKTTVNTQDMQRGVYILKITTEKDVVYAKIQVM